MTLDLEPEGSTLVIRQGGLRLARLLLGVPLTGLGLLFSYGAGSTVVLRSPGPDGWASALAWRVWHTERCRPLAPYRSIRVALEQVDSSPGSRGRARCQQIRLLAADPARHPSIEVGALGETQREQAVAYAQRIAAHLGLPVEIEDDGSIVESPAQVLAALEEGDEAGRGSRRGDGSIAPPSTARPTSPLGAPKVARRSR